MGWVGVLKLLLSLADQLASFMHDKQLMDAGAAKAVSASLKGALDEIQKATEARDRVRRGADAHPERLRDDDGFRRD